mgnify:CR=1 FL=1
MTITQIIYALETARKRNISKAADALFVSQSALSQQLQKLEKELGYRLFERTVHGLQITEEGSVFCEEAESLIAQWERFQKNVRQDMGLKKRHLRICMGSRVYSNGLFQDVIRFFDDHSDLEVTFVTEAGRDFVAGLKDGSVDLAIDRLPTEDFAAHQNSLYTCSLVREKQCVLMANDDPRTTRESISFRELQGATMISGLENSSEDRILKETCRKYGLTLSRVFRSDGIETNMNLVRSGKGIALGPKSFADFYHVSAVELTPPMDITLKFICLKNSLNRREILLFRDYLLATCRERGFLPED